MSRADGTPPAPAPRQGCGRRRDLLSPQRPPCSLSLVSPLLPPPAEILQANDNLTQVINLYKQLVRGEEVNGDAAAGSIPGEETAGGGGGRGAARREWHRAQGGALAPELGAGSARVTLAP